MSPIESCVPPRRVRPARPRPRATTMATLTAAAMLVAVLSSCSTSSLGASGSPTAGVREAPSAPAAPIAAQTPAIQGVTPAPPLVPSVHEVARTTILTGTSTGPARVSCPAGEVALGGGWDVPSGNRVFAAILDGNTWAVSVTHPARTASGSAPLQVTAYAECLSGVRGAVVTRRAANSSVDPASYSSVGAYCNPGEVSVGFGFDLSASSANLELQLTEPDYPKPTWEGLWLWDFSVVNHDSVARAITVFVDCLSNVDTTVDYQDKEGSYVYASMTGGVSAPCAPDEVVAGGGLSYTGRSIGNLYLLHAASGGWQGAIYGVTGYGLIPLVPTVRAACLRFS